MFYNLNQFVDHNKTFWDSMVDLKVQGWKAYTKATNAYTNNFFKSQLDNLDKNVDKFADVLKGQK
jgi:hypothetical protein